MNTVKKKLNFIWQDVKAVSILLLSIITVYRWVPQTFFQQDEWYSMGQSMLVYHDPSILFHVIAGMHITPIAQLWFTIQYALFGMHAAGYLYINIATHVVVSIEGYMVMRSLNVRPFPALIGMLFFAINPVSSQVISWISASVIGGFSVMLFLGGCVLWLRTRATQSAFLRSVVFLLFLASLFTKEDIVVGFIFIFVFSFLFAQRKAQYFIPIIASLIVWLIASLLIWRLGFREIIPQSHKTFWNIGSYLSTIPQWLSSVILTSNTLRMDFQSFFGLYSSYFPFIQNDLILNFISFFVTFLWYLWFFLTTVYKKVPLKKILIFPVCLTVSLIPYFFSISTGLESRHFYIPVFITGMWIAFYLNWVIQNRYDVLRNITVLFFLILFALYGVGNKPVDDYMPFQKKRAMIVSEMQKIATPSSGTVVYYFEDGSSSPFQSGIGQMLLVLQARGDASFIPYFNTNFLWSTFEEGYKKIGTKGFGYYFDRDHLKKDYSAGLFSKETIRTYQFDPEKRTINHIGISNLLNL